MLHFSVFHLHIEVKMNSDNRRRASPEVLIDLSANHELQVVISQQ